MNIEGYCRGLIAFKKDGVRLSSYMGRRWFVSKAMVGVAACLMLARSEEAFRIVGYMLLGYALGMIVAGIRSYVVGKKRWELQKELIDWKKVEEYLGRV